VEIRVTHPEHRIPIAVLQPVGSIHLGNAAELETTARSAVASGSRAIVIDLTEVPTMTSAGLRVLHVLYRLLGGTSAGAGANPITRSPHLKLVNPSSSLRNVLAIAGFDTFLEIHDTAEEAIASFAQASDTV
jgi:anti-anti-sigma factor